MHCEGRRRQTAVSTAYHTVNVSIETDLKPATAAHRFVISGISILLCYYGSNVTVMVYLKAIWLIYFYFFEMQDQQTSSYLVSRAVALLAAT